MKNYKQNIKNKFNKIVFYIKNVLHFKFKISKVSKKTLNTVQNVVGVVLNSEERKKFLQKKLRQNKLKLLIEFVLFISFVILIGIHLFLQKINPNDFKQSIEKSVKKELQLDLVIHGDIKWTFKIYPAIELNNIVIKNILIGKNYYTAKIGSVKTRISLISLLNGKNVISKVHLNDISLILSDKIESNINNFKLSADKKSKVYVNRTDLNKSVDLTDSFSNLKFDIKEILIRNTVVKLKLENIESEFKVNNLIVQHILDDNKIAISSHVTYKNQSVRLSIITSALKYWLNNSDNIPVSMKIMSAGNSIFESNFIAKKNNKSFVYIGSINFSSDNPRKLLKMFTDEDFYVGKINLSVEVIGNKNFASFRNISLKFANSDLYGNVDMSFKNRLTVDVNLKSKLIDLPKIFWPDWRTDLKDDLKSYSEFENQHELNAFKDVSLLLDYIKKINLNLELSIDKLKAMPEMPIDNIAIKFLLNDNILSLSDLSLNYANGFLNISGIGLINNETKLDATLSVSADSINIGNIVNYTGYEGFVKSGSSQMKMFLKSSGSDLSELMSRINGGFKIYSIDKIHIKEISNYMKGDDILFSLLDFFTKKKNSDSENIDNINQYDAHIECFVLNGTIKDGVYKSDLGFAIETDKLNIVVDGNVDLGKELIDMKLITFPKSGVQFSSNAADMISVSGNLSEPDVRLRLSGTVFSIAKTGVLSFAIAPITGGLSVATLGIGFVAKVVWDNISAKKSPCNVALTLPINKDLSQEVYLNSYNARKNYNDNIILFNNLLKKEKRIFQNSLR